MPQIKKRSYPHNFFANAIFTSRQGVGFFAVVTHKTAIVWQIIWRASAGD
jgi:hypothetical protein